jgi:hypothetical protein
MRGRSCRRRWPHSLQLLLEMKRGSFGFLFFFEHSVGAKRGTERLRFDVGQKKRR